MVGSICWIICSANVRAAGLQAIQVGSRGVVHAADVFEVNLQRNKLVLEREPAGPLESFEIGGTQPAVDSHAIAITDASH